MNKLGGENSDSMPIDLIIEIFSRLPAKSVARFRCVSKLWSFMLRCPYFTELFLKRSSARPRLLFVVTRAGEWSFYSSHQHQNPYEKSSSSLVVNVDFLTKFPKDTCALIFSDLTSGLDYFSSLRISKESEDRVPVIFNPITGQYVSLPKLRKNVHSYSFLGFDPIDKQFKVMCMAHPLEHDDNRVLTLGTEKMMWRKIQCPLRHNPFHSFRICINGVLYYLADRIFDHEPSFFIVCFDVRSEKFKFIDAQSFLDCSFKLIDYKGKLGGIRLGYAGNTIELRVCVLEDVEKQEWSKRVYTFGDNIFIDPHNDSIVGVTATGEIVLTKKSTSSKQFYVFYFSPEGNTLQSVEIKGLDLEKDSIVCGFVDYVEDFNVNDAKGLKSSKWLNNIRKRPKPQRFDDLWKSATQSHL